ncbi:hypothetical protein PIROE2DRAFT_56731 [Piromyces sp. E2]|nr:hypothetical protein PIROE2DRAFT_56731 [Piromyces sp. E2]|eukprot:OUM70712.1 hypothetical protein PIROE2DRAFT_56731 [Piromyces sp. E2]
MKSTSDVDDKLANAASAAENAPLYGNSNENSSNSVSSANASTNNNSDNTTTNASTTSLNTSSTYFGNRSTQNINGAKKSFEKRYNSISFSPNVNLHSSILNSSPILKPKKTLHVTNFTMNKCALRNLLLSFSGFKTVAFYQDYCFVVFADIESATAAAEQLLAKTKLKVNFSKADYIPNVVSPSSIGNPNSILHVTNYPTSTTETEMIEMYSSYPGYLHIHFSKNFSLVYYQDIASAKNVLQHMNQTTNFTTIYSIKNANNSPINMNNNYHNNVPNGPPPPFNPMMNNAYRNMGVNGGLVMANGYPPPPVSATAPTTSNFNANGVINHPHNNGPNGVNVSPNPNNSYIKYNNSSSNLAGLTNTSNGKMNSYGPGGGASTTTNNLFGFNNANNGNGNGMVNPPVKMNSMPNPAINGMSYFGGMSKPMNLSPNYGKNQNNMTRKHSVGAELSNQFLHMNITRDNDEDSNNINDIIKSSISQSKSETNLSGLLNRKGSTSIMTALESNAANNGGSNSAATSPFFKKSSIYDDMNSLKPNNSNQLLSAGNFGVDRNDFMASRKLSNASSILMDGNGQNVVNSMYDSNSNYPNNKFVMPSDVSFTREYGKGGSFNSMLPIQNYGNYTESSPTQQQQQSLLSNKEGSITLGGTNSKMNISDPISKDLFNQMNYSSMNDPDALFNNLSRTLSDSALNQNKLFEDENDVGNTSINLSSTEKLHPSMALNNNLHQGSSTSAFNITNANSEKLPFMPLNMSGHGSVLPGGNNSESIRTTVKQNSLSSVDLMGMTNLYNGPINSNSFTNPLLNPTLPNARSNSSSPYLDLNHNNNNGNLISATGMANTSFSGVNALPSILNKSRSFYAINSLNNDSNKNPNDLSFTSIFSSADKKDSNSSLDNGITLINSRYGVESPKSMYEPGLKNLKVNEVEYDESTEKSKSVGVIGESTTKLNDKANGNNDTFENDYNLKVNNAFSKDISSSYSDSSINEDFIEFIASKRTEDDKDNLKPENSNNNVAIGKANNNKEAEGKELNNATSQKSSISSVTSPTIIYSPTYNEKNELSMDEVLFNGNKVSSSSSSSTTQINSKVNNLSYSTLINPGSNESFLNSTKTDDITTSNDIKQLQDDTKSNEELIKQLYAKIEQLQKEKSELTKANNYQLYYILKLEDQLEMNRFEISKLKEQLNRL